MANLVLYDSQYGNTEKIAQTIGDVVGAKIIKVQDFKKEMLEGVYLLIVGCPIHGWRPSELTRSFLAALPPDSLKGINVAAFDTRIRILFLSGSASDKVNTRLVELGGNSVVEPGKFIVKETEGPLIEGEVERAKIWAKHILKKVND